MGHIKFSERKDIEKNFMTWASKHNASATVGNFIAWLQMEHPDSRKALKKIKDIDEGWVKVGIVLLAIIATFGMLALIWLSWGEI